MSRPQIHVETDFVNNTQWRVSVERGGLAIATLPVFVGPWEQATTIATHLQGAIDDAYDAGRTDTQALLVRPSRPAEGYVWVAGHWREQCPPSRST